MIMRNIIAYSAAALLGAMSLASCDKEAAVQAPSEPIRLEVSVTGAAGTRATGLTFAQGSNQSSEEATVNTLQVLIFDGDRLDGYASVEKAKELTVTCTSGSRAVYAVVNGPDLSKVSSPAGITGQAATLRGSVSDFEMWGSVTETLAKDGKVVVPVDRMAARIVLRGIKNGLTTPALADDFTVDAVYLTNVAGDANYGGARDYTVSKWYNRRGYESANNLGSVTYDAVSKKIASGETLSDAHFFYCMPNANGIKVGGPWSPRLSRLVIRCTVAGKVYDYPVDLTRNGQPIVIERNHSYEINLLNITRLGNEDNGSEPNDNNPDDIDEEKPVEGVDQGFEVEVVDWTVETINPAGF